MITGKQSHEPHRDKWLGIILMATAAALFPVKDGFIKALSGSISAIEAALIYFAIQAFIAFIWSRVELKNENKRNHAFKFSTLLGLRSTFQIVAIVMFFYSIQHAPLAEAVILFSSNALFVILFSFLFFRIKTSMNILMTALVGFVGVIIVLGPSVWKLGNVHLLFALGSAISFSIYLILTERLGKIYSPNQMLLFDGVFGVGLTLLCVIVLNYLTASSTHYLDLDHYGWIFLMASGVIGTCSALLIIYAMKHAPAPLVAPLGYIEIVSAAVIGVFIFNESISLSTIIGCLIILSSSWYSGRLANR